VDVTVRRTNRVRVMEIVIKKIRCKLLKCSFYAFFIKILNQPGSKDN